MAYRIVVLLLLTLLGIVRCVAQTGGIATYDFLNLSPSARATALGGKVVSVFDKDLSVVFSNPALLNDSMHTCASLSYVNFFQDVSYSNFAYAHRFDSFGRFYAGFQNFSYGTFQETNESGAVLGNYRVGANAVTLGYGRSFGRFHGGANVRILQSTVYQMSSWGFATDFGVLYYHPEKQMGIGMVLRNVGAQFTPLHDGSTENLPIGLDIGFTKKLAKAPFRFSLIATDLLQPNLIYDNPNAKAEFDLAGNPIPKANHTVDNIFRHLIFSLEVLISKNFHLRAGYNHRRRAELRLPESNINLDGFSMGIGFRIYRFHLDYGYARFHAVGGVHQFGLNLYLNQWKRKNKAPLSNEPEIKPLESPTVPTE